jgi:Tfp pilus assembly protein PilO
MRRWRVPAAGAVAALVIVAVYFLGFRQPRSEEAARLVSETEQLRSLQVPLRRDIKGLEQVAARQDELKAALQHLERLIPSGLAQPSLLAQIQASAEGAGVKVGSVSFGDPALAEGAPPSPIPGTVLVAMPVTVIVEGRYLDIAELLRRVEVDFDRAVLVGDVAVTEADAGFPQLSGTWSGNVYALLATGDPLLVDPDAPAAEPAPPAEPPRAAG